MPTHSSILAWDTPMDEVAGYSPWGHKQLDATEVPEHAHTYLKMSLPG